MRGAYSVHQERHGSPVEAPDQGPRDTASATGEINMLGTKEHYDLMAQFERDQAFSHRRLDREDKSFWPKGVIYQDGQTNELFLAYRRGYALGIAGAAA
jgi:hypothetical protein